MCKLHTLGRRYLRLFPSYAQMGYTSVQTQQTVSLNLAHLGFEATTAGREFSISSSTSRSASASFRSMAGEALHAMFPLALRWRIASPCRSYSRRISAISSALVRLGPMPSKSACDLLGDSKQCTYRPAFLPN